MNTRTSFLIASCALVVGGVRRQVAGYRARRHRTDAAADAAPATETAPASPPQGRRHLCFGFAAAAPEATNLPGGHATAATEIESNDLISFNVGSIAVPASCTDSRSLESRRHVGGSSDGPHVVIAKASDVRP